MVRFPIASSERSAYWTCLFAALIQFGIAVQAIDDMNAFNVIDLKDDVSAVPALCYEIRSIFGAYMVATMSVEWDFFASSSGFDLRSLLLRIGLPYICFTQVQLGLLNNDVLTDLADSRSQR